MYGLCPPGWADRGEGGLLVTSPDWPACMSWELLGTANPTWLVAGEYPELLLNRSCLYLNASCLMFRTGYYLVSDPKRCGKIRQVYEPPIVAISKRRPHPSLFARRVCGQSLFGREDATYLRILGRS